ncbi:MAG: NnrU family protein [Deltaproteobacteria bacterium]|nr:NnrU family protein [Deltaproteobacteria bacterium]
MLSLLLASVFFVGIHLFVSGTSLRDVIVGKIGEQPYLGLFALLSLGGIVWMSMSYGRAPDVELWGQLDHLWWLALLLMVIAFLLAVIGITTPSPTSAGGEGLLEKEDAARGILRITRHPFLSGAAIWAATHLLVNGDLASLVFFGAFLVLTVSGPVAIDRKRARALGDDWERFAAVTSRLPFAAIAQGRNSLVLSELIGWRLALALVLLGAVYYFHDSIFGVPASPF